MSPPEVLMSVAADKRPRRRGYANLVLTIIPHGWLAAVCSCSAGYVAEQPTDVGADMGTHNKQMESDGQTDRCRIDASFLHTPAGTRIVVRQECGRVEC